MAIPLDGSTADMVALGTGVLAIFFRPIRRAWNKSRPCFKANDCVTDFLNGVSLTPFVCLVGAVASSTFLEEVMKSGKLTMATAGVLGVIFILRELFYNK